MTKQTTRSLFRALMVSGLVLGVVSTAYAGGTSTWTGDGDGVSWADAGNWDTIPTFDGTTDVVFDQGSISSGGATLSLGGDRDIKSLRFNNDNGPVTLGSAGTTDTLTLESGDIISGARSTVNTDILLGTDGTLGTGAYHHPLVINGDIGEVGGPRSLTFTTSGGRSTYINGDLNYTGATDITGGRSNYLGGANHSSGITVGNTGRIAYLGAGTVEALSDGPLVFHDDSGFRTAGYDLTIDNPTSMGGTVHVASVQAYGTNFITDLPGTTGRARWRFVKPVTLTDDLTLKGGSYYQRSAATEFAAGFTGDHHVTFDLTRSMEVTGASTHTGGTSFAGGEVFVTVEGALGTGGVTVAGSEGGTAELALETGGAIDPGATLTLGDGNGAKWSLVLDYGDTQTVAGLVIDGQRIAPGTTYSASDYTGSAGEVKGLGKLYVAPEDVPEPASLSLLGLGTLALLTRGRRRASR